MRRLLPFLVLLTVAGLGWPPSPAAAAPQVAANGRASVSSTETPTESDAVTLDITDGGRYVLMMVFADDLSPADDNGKTDVYVRDLVAGTTTLVSVSDDEQAGNGDSTFASISDDGRRVAFTSEANDLVDGDTLGHADVFLRDLAAGTTTRLSVGPGGEEGNGDSTFPQISGDGTKVAFQSTASNLVPEDENGVADVFVRNLNNDFTARANVSLLGRESDFAASLTDIDEDGSVVVFSTVADDLVGATDTNNSSDVYARNLATDTTFRVSVGSGGTQGSGPSFEGQVNDAGNAFAFSSDAPDLVPDDGDEIRDVFVRTLGGTTERVSVDRNGGDANGDANDPAINASGSVVAFSTKATDQVPPGADTNGSVESVVVRNLATDTTRIVSTRPGVVPDGESESPRVSDVGVVAFNSEATNLVPNDTNGSVDAFVAGEVCQDRLVTVDLRRGQSTTGFDDVILGTAGADTVDGKAGADRFCGLAGGDRFVGGAGADRALGGAGTDTLRGLGGRDRLDGGGGDDVLKGGNDGDTLLGAGGRDLLEGGNGNDSLAGGPGRDTCRGQAGRDTASACETKAGIP